MKAVILAGSHVVVTPRLTAQTRGAELVIAADGGLRHARSLGLVPDLVVGDFDSVAPEDLAAFAGVPQVRHKVDKDELDLELALAAAVERGASDLVLVGTLGERFDQSLAAVFIGAAYSRKGFGVSLHNGRHDVFLLADSVLADSAPRSFDFGAGQPFSLLSLVEVSVLSVQGARFGLEHALLPFGVGLGVSNRVLTPPLEVTLESGLVALVAEYNSEYSGEYNPEANPDAAPEARIENVKNQIWGDKAEQIETALRALDPDLADLVSGVAYDGVFARAGLDLKTKELLAVAHLVALGTEAELKTHLYGALNCGATPEEIKETLLHAAMFVGFPKAVAAFKVWRGLKREEAS